MSTIGELRRGRSAQRAEMLAGEWERFNAEMWNQMLRFGVGFAKKPPPGAISRIGVLCGRTAQLRNEMQGDFR